jgi:ankyrin repeat protein
MNLLVSSVHPAEAGVQSALVEVLLDGGAAIDGLADDRSPLLTALAFGYADAAAALAARGARVDDVLTAAGLGRDDLVDRFVGDDGNLRPDVPRIAPVWSRMSGGPQAHVRLAFVWACAFGRTKVVDVLLRKHVDPGSADQHGQTGLHLAAAYGHHAVIEQLLAHGAPLEARNQWGGTVLGLTVYFARHASRRGVDYPPILERLIAAGADVSVVRFPTGHAGVDEVLKRHASR